MTKPRYPVGCADRSQVCGEALSSPYAGNSDNAWNVNFNNGNCNWNNVNNNGFVRAVRSARAGECQGAGVTFRELCCAWEQARSGKKPSANQLAFDTRWLDRLLVLQRRLNAGTWRPSRVTCFVATKPKAREIHAPDFADRVVHHWLVPQLEAIFEPGFIYDSFSNQKGKGTHAAVDRLKSFVREVHSGQGGGWYLQLDIANFFNRIHRPTLWRMLKHRMVEAGTSQTVQRATHALLRHSPLHAGAIHCSTAAERALVPPHKRLENAPAGYGIAIGNLSSQFFANVYLDALDQFVKHTLKAKRYLRYVDDFVLVHQDRKQLEAWKSQIETFLREILHLELKADVKMRPLSVGIDFLGYVIYPTHTLVRQRVVSHLREALSGAEQAYGLKDAESVRIAPFQIHELRSIWRSYEGHFSHASAYRLRASLHQRYPWLHSLVETPRRFSYRLERRRIQIILHREHA